MERLLAPSTSLRAPDSEFVANIVTNIAALCVYVYWAVKGSGRLEGATGHDPPDALLSTARGLHNQEVTKQYVLVKIFTMHESSVTTSLI
jgi:hypothetical protein